MKIKCQCHSEFSLATAANMDAGRRSIVAASRPIEALEINAREVSND